MANDQNLIPNSKRTPSELREMTKKGGIASGKARRKKANLKKAFETILQADVASPSVKNTLESMGFEATNEMALALAMFQKAMKGNVRAAEWIGKNINNDKDELDRKEQRQRIKSLELDNQKKKSSLKSGNSAEDSLARYFNELKHEILNVDK